MIVALYTSRKILETLGVDDFGIFNVVGGIILVNVFYQRFNVGGHTTLSYL